MAKFSLNPALANIGAIWSSTETKALESAAILAGHLQLPVRQMSRLGENDRSSTGYLPPAEFERMADAFFGNPDESVRDWECARAAQNRMKEALQEVLCQHQVGDLAIVSHGAVGTLLLCALADLPISREHDQPSQGHYWVAALKDLTVTQTWRPLA
jgi:broad specificity phosphatase PhoE